MFDSRELDNLQKQLSDKFSTISKAYVRMSKAKDLLTRNVIQSGIDNCIREANELSDKTEALKKQLLEQWQNKRNENAQSKSKYD